MGRAGRTSGSNYNDVYRWQSVYYDTSRSSRALVLSTRLSTLKRGSGTLRIMCIFFRLSTANYTENKLPSVFVQVRVIQGCGYCDYCMVGVAGFHVCGYCLSRRSVCLHSVNMFGLCVLSCGTGYVWKCRYIRHSCMNSGHSRQLHTACPSKYLFNMCHEYFNPG